MLTGVPQIVVGILLILAFAAYIVYPGLVERRRERRGSAQEGSR